LGAPSDATVDQVTLCVYGSRLGLLHLEIFHEIHLQLFFTRTNSAIQTIASQNKVLTHAVLVQKVQQSPRTTQHSLSVTFLLVTKIVKLLVAAFLVN